MLRRDEVQRGLARHCVENVPGRPEGKVARIGRGCSGVAASKDDPALYTAGDHARNRFTSELKLKERECASRVGIERLRSIIPGSLRRIPFRQREQSISRLSRADLSLLHVDIDWLMQMLVDPVRIVDLVTDSSANDFVVCSDLELESTSFGEDSLELAGKCCLVFDEIVSTQPVETATDFTAITESKRLFVGDKRANRIVGRQDVDKCPDGFNGARVDSGNGVCQFVVSSMALLSSSSRVQSRACAAIVSSSNNS